MVCAWRWKFHQKVRTNMSVDTEEIAKFSAVCNAISEYIVFRFPDGGAEAAMDRNDALYNDLIDEVIRRTEAGA